MTTPIQDIATTVTTDELLATLVTLRTDVLTEGEKLHSDIRRLIERTDYLASAQNLAYYLALRRRDLRDLQSRLMQYGLSSLGRSESRVMPTLEAVIASLAAISHKDNGAPPNYAPAESFFYGANEIDRQADEIFGLGQNGRNTRIMVTLPTEAATDLGLIQALVEQGIECVRINCAHDSESVWVAMIANVRLAEQTRKRPKPVKVLMDLAGPKVRTMLPKKGKKPQVMIGDKLLLVRDSKNLKRKDDLPRIGCTLVEVHDHLRVGAQVWIDDGQIGLVVTELKAEGALLHVVQAPPEGKKIRPDKGLNFPDTDLAIAPLTPKDRQDLAFIADHADMIGYSFVQSAEDVALLQAELMRLLGTKQPLPALVLKIETQRAVRNLPQIMLRAAGRQPTAVMIARGDLAVELGYKRIAEMQEEILWLCEAAHLPVIWATQVLEQLAKTGVPTRAEVSDAAMGNRAECVMLNKGPFIVQTVQLLDDVLRRMQAHQDKKTPRLRALQAWEDLFSNGADAVQVDEH